MVVIFLPSASLTEVWQERTASPFDVNRAGAAETCAATEFGTVHLQLLANDPEQRRIVGGLDGHIPSVDIEIWPLPSLRCMKPLTAEHSWLLLGTHQVDAGRRAE